MIQESKRSRDALRRANARALVLFLLFLASMGLNAYQFYSYKKSEDQLAQELSTTTAAIKFLENENKSLKEALTEVREAKSVARTLRHRGQLFDTYQVDLRKSDLKLYWKDEEGQAFGNLGRLKSWLESRGEEMLFGMNAGMYQVDNSPQGLYVEGGQEGSPLDLGDSERFENFYLKPNGVFYLTDSTAEIMETLAYSARGISPRLATQSGPMLLINGNFHPAFREASSNLNIRNGVGIVSPTEVVFIISQQPVNFYTFASVFKEKFGCKNALYLDGAISKMYLPSLGRQDLGGNLGPLLVETES